MIPFVSIKMHEQQLGEIKQNTTPAIAMQFSTTNSINNKKDKTDKIRLKWTGRKTIKKILKNSILQEKGKKQAKNYIKIKVDINTTTLCMQITKIYPCWYWSKIETFQTTTVNAINNDIFYIIFKFLLS